MLLTRGQSSLTTCTIGNLNETYLDEIYNSDRYHSTMTEEWKVLEDIQKNENRLLPLLILHLLESALLLTSSKELHRVGPKQ